jgi:5'-3' exonuclease
MGIPGYFYKYVTRYPETIIKNKIELIEALFVDFNCAIHPCCRKFSQEHYSHNRREICEKHMIEECIAYLVKIIKYANPTKLVYVAIDGVAPRAKMIQQRNRRFKSIKDKKLDVEIKQRNNYHDPNYNKDHEDEYWDTNSISPGTVFMSKLAEALRKFFNEEEQFFGLNIIISDSNQPGEGEHKILEYIKHMNNEKNNNTNTETNIDTELNTDSHLGLDLNLNITGKIVIYGLDADLIMLSLVSHINQIYLLRESSEFGSLGSSTESTSVMTYCYLDIDLFKFSLINELTSKIPNTVKLEMTDKLQMVDDYVFLCFMIGNDFLPNLPPLNIKDSGIDLLTDIYCSIFSELAKVIKKYEWVRDNTIYSGDTNGSEMEGGWRPDRSNYTAFTRLEFLVDTEKCTINYNFFCKLFERLSLLENELMINLETKRSRLRPHNSKTHTPYDIEKTEMESYPILPANREEELSIDIRNQDNNWQLRYYRVCFHFEPTHHNIDDVCYKYIQGLLWNLTYYYNGCSSWEWCYPYHHAPTIKHLYEFAFNKECGNEKWKTVRLHKTPPFRPFEQLMFILPQESKHLLPETYQTLFSSTSPVIQYYPEDYKFDTIFRRYFWQCPPILPPINTTHLKKVLQKKTLTKEEQLRDSTTEPTVIKSKK